MEYSSQRFMDVVTFAPKGRIDQGSADAFQQAVTLALAEVDAHSSSLLLDFSAVDYISSVGLRVVMMAARHVRARPARIAVTGLQPLVREIFEISRFHHVVEVFPSLRDGLAALSAPAVQAFDSAQGHGA